MIVGVFSARRNPELDDAGYAALNERMWEIIAHRPAYGLIGIAGYKDAGDRPLVMAFFESREAMLAWKADLEHAAAQQRGREEFFLEYWGFVAEMLDAYEFDREGGRRQVPLDSRWRPPGFEGPLYDVAQAQPESR